MTGCLHLVHYEGSTFKCRVGLTPWFRSDDVAYISKDPSGYRTAEDRKEGMEPGQTRILSSATAFGLHSEHSGDTVLLQSLAQEPPPSPKVCPRHILPCSSFPEIETLHLAGKLLNTEGKQLKIAARGP